MILGAGAGQLPFINIARKKGAYVIVISPKGKYPGIELADKFYAFDTRDKEQILNIAKQEKIDAVTTDQTDVSVPTVAYIAKKLGLKGIGYEKALEFTDKYKMRCAANKLGINVPQFALAKNLDEAKECIKKMSLPVIIKPTDSSGSRGVFRIDTITELNIHFSENIQYSYSNSVIIEEFIVGKEYLADGFAMEGNYINLDLGIKSYFDKKGMYISKMCMFSSAGLIEKKEEQMVLDVNQKLIQGLGLEFGITHGEYIYDPKKEKVYLVEIAARGGGVYLSSDLTPTASGVATNEMLLDYLLDEKTVDLSQINLQKKVAAWRCFALREGIVKKIDKNELKNIKGVDKICLDNLKVGDMVKNLSDDTTKYGPILVSADNRRECFDILKKVENSLEIITEKNGVQSKIIW